MGVAIAGGTRTRAGRALGFPTAPVRARRREARPHAGPRLVPAPGWQARGRRKGFWARMDDDRELIPLKTLLLGSLILAAAVLELVA